MCCCFNYCINKLFLEHPHSVNMTYIQHCVFSTFIGNYFLMASIQAYTHGCIPYMFETSSSDSARDISEIIHLHRK